MGHHVIDPREIGPAPDRPCEKRSISGRIGLENLGLHVYEAAPGEEIPLSYHYHEEQEEAFYVLEGTLAVETPEGTLDAEAGTAFVAEPESPHRAYNPERADESVRVLAVGAPPVDDGREYEP